MKATQRDKIALFFCILWNTNTSTAMVVQRYMISVYFELAVNYFPEMNLYLKADVHNFVVA